jgi:hypothetical protein
MKKAKDDVPMKNLGDLGDVQIDDSDHQKPSNPPLET